MFALRRIAARAVFAQPARQLSTLRPAQPRASIFHPEQATLYRSFHQSRRWLADEEKKPAEQAEASPAEAETSSETVTTEPSAAEQKEIREESIETRETVEAAKEKAEDVVSKAQEGASSAAQTAQDVVSSAAETVSNAASAVAETARQQFPPRNPPSGPVRDTPPNKILYVGNLFFEVTAAQLEAEFGRFGKIANSRVVTDGRGLSKGFGYVEFADQSSADRAIQELNQTTLQGRRVTVQYHLRREPRNVERKAYPQNEPSKTLFIGNMSYQMSDRDLNDLFREIRNVLDVRVAIDRRSGQPRGFAHADFIDIASAQRAKEHLEQKVVYGRQLRIDYSKSSAQSNQGI